MRRHIERYGYAAVTVVIIANDSVHPMLSIVQVFWSQTDLKSTQWGLNQYKYVWL